MGDRKWFDATWASLERTQLQTAQARANIRCLIQPYSFTKENTRNYIILKHCIYRALYCGTKTTKHLIKPTPKRSKDVAFFCEPPRCCCCLRPLLLLNYLAKDEAVVLLEFRQMRYNDFDTI